ncbi:hypothetical protein ACL9RI_26940 [Janthinobacterium sp. Mn2066]|uniref:hypothetical protein n=1 Tax=Janthinobacterium sp. Mn2066 TaxID=3395264 RepID=UPI003BC81A62
MKIRLIAGLAVHALGCLLFVFLSWLGFYLYTQLFGALGSVGIAGAKAWLLVLYAYAGTNLLLALLPSGNIKPRLCTLLGAVVLACLLRHHPLRALYFSLLAGGLSWLAVLLGQKLALQLQA